MNEALANIVHELATKMLDGETSYDEALVELRKRYEDSTEDRFEDRENGELFLQKIRDKAKVKIKADKQPRETGIYPLTSIPEYLVWPIMEETIEAIRSGVYTNEIIERLMCDYGLSDQLAMFFNNEALNAVKMKTLSTEEFTEIGQEYNRQMLEALRQQKMAERSKKKREALSLPEPIKVQKVDDAEPSPTK